VRGRNCKEGGEGEEGLMIKGRGRVVGTGRGGASVMIVRGGGGSEKLGGEVGWNGDGTGRGGRGGGGMRGW